MNEDTTLHHTALQYQNKKQAETFFINILGMKPSKSFTISSELSNKIFGIIENVEVQVYENKYARFEVFITKQTKPSRGYDHYCIIIEDKAEFITRCKQYGIKPNVVERDDKKLLFVKDFSGNLFEVKERQK